MTELAPPPTSAPRTRSGPFFLLVVMVLALTVAWSVGSRPELRSPGRLTLVIALALVHAAGHWRLLQHPASRWTPLLLGQGVLAVALGGLLQAPETTLTLALILVGECVATLPRRQAWIAGAALLALPAGHAVLAGSAELQQLLWVLVPTTVFVVVWVEAFQRQARERDRAEAALHQLDAAHAELAAYAGKVEALTLQSERHRMARELHDTLSQGLAGMILQLEAADAHLQRGDPARVGAILAQARDRARATLVEARAAIDDLRAAPATGPGLREVLLSEVERFSASTGLPCELSLADDLPPVGAERRAHLQRFVGECLTNVARHARASRVSIRVGAGGGQVSVEVQDDGSGFVPAEVEAQGGHYGLVGMRERARLSGGTLEVVSAPGQGARLTLRVPADAGRAR